MRRRLAACVVPLALLAAGAASASAATYTVTTTADTAVNDADCQPALCSLRQAVSKAIDGDTVVLPASATPYLVSNGQLVVLRAITIKGAGAGSSVIEATAANHDRVMLISGNSSAVSSRISRSPAGTPRPPRKRAVVALRPAARVRSS